MKTKRYSRQEQLKEFGPLAQEKLGKAAVLVVGLGGLGIPVVQYLNAMGIGRLGLVDHDQVDLTNLHRQVLYDEKDVGHSKMERCLARLRAQNSNTVLEPFETYLNRENALEIIGQYDLVVDASDNFPTRYLINDACVILNRPFIYGALHGFEGQVSVFNYEGGPTYRCLFPQMPGPSEVPRCDENGVLGVLPGIIGNFQALEAVKLITGTGSVLSGQLLLYNGLNPTLHNIRFSLNPDNIKRQTLQESYAVPVCTTEAEIDALQLAKILKTTSDHRLVDVRSQAEFEQDHLDGAVNIPLEELNGESLSFNPKEQVYLICQSGSRSLQALYLLQKRFPDTDFVQVEGGLDRIRAAKHLV